MPGVTAFQAFTPTLPLWRGAVCATACPRFLILGIGTAADRETGISARLQKIFATSIQDRRVA